jgi:hypothetical protein
MNEQPHLTEAEWALVVELLECEEAELPTEIHHTRTTGVREELRARQHMVRALLGRLRAAAPA